MDIGEKSQEMGNKAGDDSRLNRQTEDIREIMRCDN